MKSAKATDEVADAIKAAAVKAAGRTRAMARQSGHTMG